MTLAVLDIGAGSTAFARDFLSANQKRPMLVLCGEPEWGWLSFLSPPVTPEAAVSLIEQQKRGVRKIEASYEGFKLPDGSLDIVTLNCPHPFMGPRAGFPTELGRTLKSGGYFISSYPAFDMGLVPDSFVLVREGRWSRSIRDLHRPVHIPEADLWLVQSPTIAGNILAHGNGSAQRAGSGYLYRDGISPGFRIWKKP